MSDAPERIAMRWEVGAAVTSGPLMMHPEYTQYRRADLPRPEDAARIAELEKALIEVTHPDFIWGALDNVYDAETTLDEYAEAVSRAQRAALAADSGAAE